MKIIVFIGLCLFQFSVLGFELTIDPSGQECFKRHLIKGNKLGFEFNINEKSSIEMEKYIKLVVHDEANGDRHEFSAENNMQGFFMPKFSNFYEFCFVNSHTDLTEIITFSIWDESYDSVSDDSEDSFTLPKIMEKTLDYLNKIGFEIEVQQVRDKVHHEGIHSLILGLNKLENSLKYCAYIKLLVLFVISAAQIYIMMSFFKGNETKFRKIESELSHLPS